MARKRTSSPDASEAERALVALARQLEARHRLRIFRSPRLLHALGEATVWVEASNAALHRARATARPAELARAELIHAQALRVLASARSLDSQDDRSVLALGFEPASLPRPIGAQA